MPDLFLDVVRESDSWAKDAALKKLARRVLSALEAGRPGSAGHVTFVFSNDSMVHVLNREWRGRDKPTNVLSFPDGDPDENGLVHLGDVILAHETVAREAAEAGIALDDHLAHLLLHGALHLLGYDHMTEEEADTMEKLEVQILASLGIKDPYQERGAPLD